MNPPSTTGVSQRKFLTVEDLMERWQVCRATIYAEIKRGRLKKTLIAGCARFAITEVERYERVS